ncbi:hypothetical protein CQ018_17180 [Arthrobacter sp. MYb227]|uniref:hypothetical protein n=1 Tax=Arthrobacter sp. MYb227 TaxID=1848601 RepID=UPI000CFB2A62|nr:hypothetical protein [Arthrobacter sp. MYb227]PQZ88176.1 hypothetical protein CQ018_17180 [Arthrobacter sp. MYb227]
MTDSQHAGNRSSDGLAEIERATMEMTQRAEVPRWFLLSFVAVVAIVFTSFNVVPWGLTLWLASLFIPLTVTYFLLKRQRPKNRALARKSLKYMGWALLMVAVMQASAWWVPASVWLVALKGIALFLVLAFLMVRMSGAEMEARARESHERVS